MILIPVVDLLKGQVVRAIAGNRAAYLPIVSRLCEGSDLLTVARTLCGHCDSTQLYLADLDALQGAAVQLPLLRTLLQALPALELWLDAGFADAAAADALRVELGPLADRVVFVFGSESLRSREALAECFDPLQPAAAGRVLSLDRRAGQRLDAAGCWEAVHLWPSRVIVMTLERVGSGAGPDLDTLRDVRAKAPGAMLVGAGGIRDEADLSRAEEAGADAWLVASALHDGRLPRRTR